MESIKVSSITRHSSFGFVQFKSSVAAKVVLTESSHRDGIHLSTVKTAYAENIPEQDSPQNILNALNDDCLVDLFSAKCHQFIQVKVKVRALS